jgi:hypothetical protein
MRPLPRPFRRFRRNLAAVLDAGTPEPGPDSLGVYLPQGGLGGYVSPRPPGHVDCPRPERTAGCCGRPGDCRGPRERVLAVDPGDGNSPAAVCYGERRSDGSFEVEYLGPLSGPLDVCPLCQAQPCHDTCPMRIQPIGVWSRYDGGVKYGRGHGPALDAPGPFITGGPA